MELARKLSIKKTKEEERNSYSDSFRNNEKELTLFILQPSVLFGYHLLYWIITSSSLAKRHTVIAQEQYSSA